MDIQDVKEDILRFCREQGMTFVGFSGAEPFDAAAEHHLSRVSNGLSCDFENRASAEDIRWPKNIYPEAQSFIAVLFPYSKRETVSSEGHGRMSAGTTTVDYHTIIREHLSVLGTYIDKTYGISSKVIVDTSPLSDRAIAVRAGLGIIRRNGMCYSTKLGSYFHIGSLLVDVDLMPEVHSQPVDPCGRCMRCVEFCPGKAIIGNYEIDSNKCVSYLTQKKGLTDDESVAIGQMIYGCDVCQRVCPANRGVKPFEEKDIVNDQVDLTDLLAISNREFASTYKQTAAGWRGKRTLQRNALAVLGNTGDILDIPFLEKFLEDERSVISQEASKAIDRINKR